MRAFPLLVLATSLLAESSARIQAPRAKADFEPTANPDAQHWKRVKPIKADIDPFGKPAGPNTFQFRVAWTPEHVYFLFECPYEKLNLKPNPSTTTETNKLWEWDVTEVFIGSDLNNIHQYKELQVSPQSEWVDLDIDRKAPKPEGWRWDSGMTVKARIDDTKKIWYGEMKVPYKALDSRPPKAGNEFRINVYRLSGAAPDRKSTMWVPTMQRSHHTPEAFGRLVLAK